MPPRRTDDIERLGVLQDPVRRRLYEYARTRGEPVTREAAARAVGVGRSLAAHHLDRLAEEGLLTTAYRRPEGTGGPGAGRPPKLYAPAGAELAVSVPPRDYELAARLLAEAADADRSAEARGKLDEVARSHGRELGRRGNLRKALAERGYEPFESDDGVLRLRNCPFHRLSAEHRDLVCGMNLSLLEGLLEGLGQDELEATLDPGPGRCCVAIRARGRR